MLSISRFEDGRWCSYEEEEADCQLWALCHNNAKPLLAVVRAAAESLDTGDIDARKSLIEALRTLDPRLLGES